MKQKPMSYQLKTILKSNWNPFEEYINSKKSNFYTASTLGGNITATETQDRMLVEARLDQLLTELVHFWHIIKWDISTRPVCAKRVSAVRSLEKDAQSVGSPRH